MLHIASHTVILLVLTNAVALNRILYQIQLKYTAYITYLSHCISRQAKAASLTESYSMEPNCNGRLFEVGEGSRKHVRV